MVNVDGLVLRIQTFCLLSLQCIGQLLHVELKSLVLDKQNMAEGYEPFAIDDVIAEKNNSSLSHFILFDQFEVSHSIAQQS